MAENLVPHNISNGKLPCWESSLIEIHNSNRDLCYYLNDLPSYFIFKAYEEHVAKCDKLKGFKILYLPIKKRIESSGYYRRYSLKYPIVRIFFRKKRIKRFEQWN